MCVTLCSICLCLNAAGVCVCLMVGLSSLLAWSPAAWCLRNEGVSSVLLGASSTDQLMENIGAIQVRPLHEHVGFSAEHIRKYICESKTGGTGLVSLPFSALKQPSLPSTARPLGQFAAARLTALLYHVNKVSRVYPLPWGLEASSRPLPPLLIRLAL